MLYKITVYFIFFVLVFCLSPWALAYDNDTEINNINLSPENFIDIKADRLRKSLELRWHDIVSGWQMTGGSLDADRLFLDTDIKLHHDLSDTVFARMEIDQEVFYARKPFAAPQIDLGGYPFDLPIGISVLSTFAYDKRQFDLGGAVILGHRPWDYLRLAWTRVDTKYNDKNDFDDSYYSKEGETWDLEGAYQLSQRYRFRFSFIKDTPLQLITPEDNGVFDHKKFQYHLSLDYQLKPKNHIGMAVKGFELEKSKRTDSENRQQHTRFNSVEVYWLDNIDTQYELTVGAQMDYIKNRFSDRLNNSDSLQYHMQTWQMYGILHHDYSEHQGWDLGLYLSQVNEKEDYYSTARDDVALNQIESKFRTSWQYKSLNEKSVLLIHMSFNLDDLKGDPTDGGGMSFQTSF